MATNCTLLPGPPPTPPELMLGQREVATGHQGSVAAVGDPPGSHRGGWVPGGTATAAGGCSRGNWGARSPRAPVPASVRGYTHRPETRTHAGTRPLHSYTHTRHTQSLAESSPNARHPPPAPGPCTPRRRGPRPRPHSDPLRQLAPLSRLPTAAEETHTGPQRTSAQAHACQRGHGQGHVCGSRPPGLGALQGASYFREPSLAGEGGLAWRACHRAHNTPLALGSPS